MVFLLLAGFAATACAVNAPGPHPNVIIILTDDQGYGDLSCTGNPVLKTPRMDALHDTSLQLTNFHVDSYCSPTRAALMTGRYAHRVGVWGTVSGRNILRDDEVTMAEVFRHNGYRTGHFGKWHLGTHFPYRPIDRGFDEWLGHGDGGTGTTTDHWGNDRVNDTYIHNGGKEQVQGFEADVFFDAAMRFIRADTERPFFIYLATYNPHTPCSLPDGRWVDPYRGKVPLQVAYFFASIARVDENLGRLRQFLKSEGLSDNTILLFLSDNGTSMGEEVFNAGMRGKKGSEYEGGHRVPCLIHWPAGGFDEPVDVDRLTAHVDLLPTLADLCSLTLPRPIAFDGSSLKPLLTNPKGPWPSRTLILGTPANIVAPKPPSPRHGKKCAVMTGRWRLVNLNELYDMDNDPGQEHDIAGRHHEIVTQLRASYEQYWSSVSAGDVSWRGRPVIGSPQAQETNLCAEDWYPTQGACPWNQSHIAGGDASLGYWTVRIAKAGMYRVELRRWPREVDTPMTGVPSSPKTVDAYLDDKPITGLLYGGTPKALPVARARLRIGTRVQEAEVATEDTSIVFTVILDAGPADIETGLLDKDGKPLCGAHYVYVRRQGGGKGGEKAPG